MYLQSTFCSQLKNSPSPSENEIELAHCTAPFADDNTGIAKSNEYCFVETKSPSLMHLHRQHQHRQVKASLNDAAMHFSPPSKDSVNTDFTNLNTISESGRNSVSRQSLIGEWVPSSFFCFLLRHQPFGLAVNFHHLPTYPLRSSMLSENFIAQCRPRHHHKFILGLKLFLVSWFCGFVFFRTFIPYAEGWGKVYHEKFSDDERMT